MICLRFRGSFPGCFYELLPLHSACPSRHRIAGGTVAALVSYPALLQLGEGMQ